MTREAFQAMIQKGPVLLDGATGSVFRKRGMPVGVSTEQWAYEHPDTVAGLQLEYVDAGSQIIYAPTFGANRESLSALGLSGRIAELNTELVRRTVGTVGDRALVAGDMTTTGKALEPMGDMTYDRLLEIYKEQMELLRDAGVDLFAAETLLSLDEALVLCDAANAVSELPLMVSFTCEGDGNLYFGGNIFEAAAALEAMGASAVGVNCSVGPDQLSMVIRELSTTVSIPVVAKPNAGMPLITETGEAVYSMGEDEFARHMRTLKDCGAVLLGGCCGTTPDYIRKVKKIL